MIKEQLALEIVSVGIVPYHKPHWTERALALGARCSSEADWWWFWSGVMIVILKNYNDRFTVHNYESFRKVFLLPAPSVDPYKIIHATDGANISDLRAASRLLKHMLKGADEWAKTNNGAPPSWYRTLKVLADAIEYRIILITNEAKLEAKRLLSI